MFTLENSVGRLCELRVESTFAMTDLTAFRARLATVFQSVRSRVVICSDLTRTGTVSPEVITQLIVIGKIDNPWIERHAMVVVPTHALGQQLEAVARAAGSPSRRVFHGAASARAWLDEVLEPNERDRLARFLSQTD